MWWQEDEGKRARRKTLCYFCSCFVFALFFYLHYTIPSHITLIVAIIFFLGMLIATIYSLIKFRIVEDWEKTPEGKKIKRRNIRRRLVKAIFLISSAYIIYDRWDDFLTIGHLIGEVIVGVGVLSIPILLIFFFFY